METKFNSQKRIEDKNMTREEARRAAEVMMAYAEGRDIQYKFIGDNFWKTLLGDDNNTSLSFDFNRTDYRIKTKQIYRPFKDKDECWQEMQKHQPFGWVYEKLSTAYINIHSIDSECDYNIIFDGFTFADGTPFGIKEE